MRTVEYRYLLDAKNAARIRFELERSLVQRFMVQLECCFDGKWYPVVRYDTAHNFAHRDVLHPLGETVKTKMAIQDYNQALTFAIKDLNDNWEKYRQRYEQWLRQK